MADVTGNLGGNPVELNNAATEVTLKQILAALLAQTSAMAKGGKGSASTNPKLVKELEKELKRLADANKKQYAQIQKRLEQEKKLKDANEKKLKKIKEEIAAREKQKKAMNDLAAGLGALHGAIEQTALGMTNLMSNFANLGNSLTGAAQSLNSIPLVGGVLSGVFGAVAGASEKMYNSFKEASAVGANFGGSINDMINAASGAGLTMDQFTGIIAKNGEALAYLGGSTNEGAKRLAQLGRGIKDSNLGDELARMGYSTTDINEGLAKYSGQLQKTGALQGMNNTQLIEATGQYLKNLDAVSKLTGQSKQELEQQRAARMKDAQFRMIMSKMDAKSQESLNSFLDSLPAELQEGAKEIIATGTATSDAGKAALAYLPQSARAFMGLNQQIRTTGKVSQQNARDLNAMVQSEAKAVAKSGLGETLSLYGDETQKRLMVGIIDAGQRQKTLGQIEEERAKAEKERAAKEKQLVKDGLDPAAMKTYQENISQVSNQFTKLLGSSNLLEKFFQVFQFFTQTIETYVVPMFTFMADHATIFGAILGGLAITMGTVNTILAISNMLEKIKLAQTALASGALGTFSASLFRSTIGLVVSMGQAALATLAMAAPMLPIALAIAGVATAAYVLWDYFKSLGGTTDTLVDGFKWLWSYLEEFGQNLVLLFYKIMDKVTVGDKYKKLAKEQEKKIQATKDERSALEDKMKSDLDANKKKYDTDKKAEEAKKKETEAVKSATEAKTEETKKTETATQTTAQYDFSTPYKLFESAARRAGSAATGAAAAPGAAAAAGVGSLSERYEAGSKGSGAIGWDSTGGTSYGKYQIASKTGTMNKFMDFLKTNNPEAYAALSKAGPADAGKNGQFAQVWKQLADSGKLGTSEHDFIKASHYDVGMKGIKNQGLSDMLGKSKALQEVMWSTSVQHGGGGASGIFNKVFKEGMSEQDLIKAIYSERGTRFGSSSANVQASVKNRFADEQSRALAMVGMPGQADVTPSGTQVASAVQANTAPVSGQSAAAAAAGGSGKATKPEDMIAQLESMNRQLGQLVALNKEALSVNQKQLRTSQNSTNDMFVAA